MISSKNFVAFLTREVMACIYFHQSYFFTFWTDLNFMNFTERQCLFQQIIIYISFDHYFLWRYNFANYANIYLSNLRRQFLFIYVRHSKPFTSFNNFFTNKYRHTSVRSSVFLTRLVALWLGISIIELFIRINLLKYL